MEVTILRVDGQIVAVGPFTGDEAVKAFEADTLHELNGAVTPITTRKGVRTLPSGWFSTPTVECVAETFWWPMVSTDTTDNATNTDAPALGGDPTFSDTTNPDSNVIPTFSDASDSGSYDRKSITINTMILTRCKTLGESACMILAHPNVWGSPWTQQFIDLYLHTPTDDYTPSMARDVLGAKTCLTDAQIMHDVFFERLQDYGRGNCTDEDVLNAALMCRCQSAAPWVLEKSSPHANAFNVICDNTFCVDPLYFYSRDTIMDNVDDRVNELFKQPSRWYWKFVHVLVDFDALPSDQVRDIKWVAWLYSLEDPKRLYKNVNAMVQWEEQYKPKTEQSPRLRTLRNKLTPVDNVYVLNDFNF